MLLNKYELGIDISAVKPQILDSYPPSIKDKELQAMNLVLELIYIVILMFS